MGAELTNPQSISTPCVVVVGEEGPGLMSRFLAWETGAGGTRHQVGEPKRRSGVGSEGKLGEGHIGFEIP